MSSNSELALVYAAIILNDEGLPISEENLVTVVGAAGVKVEKFWPAIFASAFESKDLGEVIASACDASGSAAGPAASGEAAAVEEEEEEEEESSSDEDMGFGGLF